MSGFVTLDGTGDYVITVDKAQLDITGDLEIIACVALDDWTPVAANTILSKWAGSYRLMVNSSLPGGLELVWNDGTANQVLNSNPTGIGATDGVAQWLRLTFDVNNGASNAIATFYSSGDPIDTAPGSVSWSQLGGAAALGSITSIAASASDLTIGIRNSAGSDPMAGKVYIVQLYDGIGGTLVANADFRDDTQGWSTPPGSDGLGNSWAFQGDAFWTAPVTGFPNAPSNLVATPVSTSQIDLSWDALSGADAYDIERDGVIIENDRVGITYSDTGLDPSTSYDYRVRGVTTP